MPQYVEELGHTWTQEAAMSSDSEPHTQARLLPASNGRVVAVDWTAQGATEVRYRASGTSPGGSSGPGSGQMGGLWAPAGSTAVAQLVRGTGRIGIVA